MKGIASLYALAPLSSASSLLQDLSAQLDRASEPATTAGNTDCASLSTNTSFLLSFISTGNYTATTSQDDNIQQMVSISFAVTNEANNVYTLCAFPLGYSSSSVAWTAAGPTWQTCADRKDTDGKHRFTIATGAEFAMQGDDIAVNQTWFCHDEEKRLVAYTGVARGTLKMSCTEGELSGYHVQNCTSPDIRLPVTLL
ncbi:hypothetical protein F5Y15DRAFT_140523 [Xylariaceae sp. FL0016]|nr:hypothetical protein F5Y15DRAFT_140523 [Xylariaceae sp. FL0016]